MKMGKKNTPKKSSAVDTSVKSEVMTQKQTKDMPAKAACQTPKVKKLASSNEAISTPKAAAQLSLKMKKESYIKEQNSTPKVAAIQTPKSSKVKKEVSNNKEKSTTKAALKKFKNGTSALKINKKTKAPKQAKHVEDVEMASEDTEEAATAKSSIKQKPSAKKAASVKTAQSKEAGEFSLFVRGLDFNSKQDNVTKHFEQFGNVTKCYIPRNPENSTTIKGHGFIEYNSQEAMDKALAAAHSLDSRTLQVSINKNVKKAPRKRKRDESQQPGGDTKRKMPRFDHELFVAKLKYTTLATSILKHFSQFGEVVNIGLPMKNKNENKGFAFVAFKEVSSMEKALAKSGQQIESANIVVTAGKTPAPREAVATKTDLALPNELFVGGLDPSTQKATLELHFSKYGKVVNVTLPWNHEDARNKGFGFVAFQSAASLIKALEEDHAIDGRRVALRRGKKEKKNGAAPLETKSKELKVASAVVKMEDDSEEDEEEDGDEEERVEDSEDNEVEGESDEDVDEDEEEDGDDEEEEDDSAVENEDEEDESDEDNDDDDDE